MAEREPMTDQPPFRPKLGILAASFALGALAFLTLFSVELTSKKLKETTLSSAEELKEQRAILLDYQLTSASNNNRDEVDDESAEIDDDKEITPLPVRNKSASDEFLLQLQISKGEILNNIPADEINQAVLQKIERFHQQQSNDMLTSSPACYPHFNHYQHNGQWNNTTKFKRILFYHARKAGGSSMNKYLVKVAQTYGIEIEWIEWAAMEEPGFNYDKDTFYVTHLREPIDRSISHFKYNGRWPCQKLIHKDFVPTEENAFKLETWNQTMGHEKKEDCVKRNMLFRLGDCAVNCYTQWFGGLNCARWEVPIEQQYEVAMSKLYKYNLVIVIEKLRDPNYVRAIENFFGVEGILEKGIPFCERISHKANAKNPLVVHNETRAKLTELNRLDLKLYHKISDCLDDGNYEQIPKWDGSRWELNSFNFTQAKIDKQRAKAAKEMKLQ